MSNPFSVHPLNPHPDANTMVWGGVFPPGHPTQSPNKKFTLPDYEIANKIAALLDRVALLEQKCEHEFGKKSLTLQDIGEQLRQNEREKELEELKSAHAKLQKEAEELRSQLMWQKSECRASETRNKCQSRENEKLHKALDEAKSVIAGLQERNARQGETINTLQVKQKSLIAEAKRQAARADAAESEAEIANARNSELYKEREEWYGKASADTARMDYIEAHPKTALDFFAHRMSSKPREIVDLLLRHTEYPMK